MEAIPSSDPEQNEDTSIDAAEEEHDNPRNVSSLLSTWQGIALLTADCLGVGVLALPNDIQTLGLPFGLTFLLLNFPINYFAGNLLSKMASQLERGHCKSSSSSSSSTLRASSFSLPPSSPPPPPQQHDLVLTEEGDNDKNAVAKHVSQLEMIESHNSFQPRQGDPPLTEKKIESSMEETNDGEFEMESFEDEHVHTADVDQRSNQVSTQFSTRDLIGISQAIFQNISATNTVMLIYYLNLFLVLGDYTLVMGRAVAAMSDDVICVPIASAIASILMFGISQFRTMALLGRKVSLVSLLAMLVVLLQCLFHHRTGNIDRTSGNQEDTENAAMLTEEIEDNGDGDIWSKFSALASIGFAVGSQKLFLNIRNELANKDKASQVLFGSLTSYGLAYLGVILLAGSDPPSFLFDAIPEGWSRRVAGLLLWGHVAVSYAINSQALCASIEQKMLNNLSYRANSIVQWHPTHRWFLLTLIVALSSYLVSNAVPFFKDLVALIGALTSVPLTLSLPALLYRQFCEMYLLLPFTKIQKEFTTRNGLDGSYFLLLYSTAFLVVGLAGAISSIDEDWLNQGQPFACR